MLLQREDLLASLSDNDLSKRLVVTPLLDPARQIGEGAVDLRLGSEFKEVRRRDAHLFDPFADPEPMDEQDTYEVPIGESLILHPGQFLLGASFEFLRMPAHIGGQVLGRSSWGRLGLIVATAVTVHPGFRGCLTLEIQNLGSAPIKLVPGVRIAQLMCWLTSTPAELHEGVEPFYAAPLGPAVRRLVSPGEMELLQKVGRSLRGADPA